MSKPNTTTGAALALLLTITLVGAAEAQTPPPAGTRLASQCAGAPFSLDGSPAKFHLALDDHASEPSLVAVMRFIDQSGRVVREKTVSLGAGKSTTLDFRGSGLFRVQAEIYELLSSVDLSERRTIVAGMDATTKITGPNGENIGILIGPPRWVPCADLP
jgi:hypothetical protein